MKSLILCSNSHILRVNDQNTKLLRWEKNARGKWRPHCFQCEIEQRCSLCPVFRPYLSSAFVFNVICPDCSSDKLLKCVDSKESGLQLHSGFHINRWIRASDEWLREIAGTSRVSQMRQTACNKSKFVT